MEAALRVGADRLLTENLQHGQRIEGLTVLNPSCATILVMAGKHQRYVQDLLGHASINIICDTSSHVSEGMEGGLAEAMDEAL